MDQTEPWFWMICREQGARHQSTEPRLRRLAPSFLSHAVTTPHVFPTPWGLHSTLPRAQLKLGATATTNSTAALSLAQELTCMWGPQTYTRPL